MQEQDLLLKLEDSRLEFTEAEAATLKQLLSSPLVRRYFMTQLNRAVTDFLVNEAETTEQKEKLVARFHKLKAVQYVITFLLNNFRPEAKPNAQKQ